MEEVKKDIDQQLTTYMKFCHGVGEEAPADVGSG